MQIISATKTAKETTLNRKRNLFGLGLTSLIAACGDKAAGGGGDGGNPGEDNNDNNGGNPGEDNNDDQNPPPAATLPFEAEKLAEAADSDYTATISGTDSLTVEVKEAEATKATLMFSEAVNNDNDRPNAVNIYQLTSTENQYDLVISAPTIDSEKGAIYIFWDVQGIQNEAIGAVPTVNRSLEIKGANADDNRGNNIGDNIGTHTSEFLQLGGKDNNYDMVIRSEWVDKIDDSGGAVSGTGAIYILWDVADYYNTASLRHTVNLDASVTGATSGSFTIYGAQANDLIGTYAPEFLQIGGEVDNYDIVIRSEWVDNPDGPSSFIDNEGGIFILWDVADYYNTASLNHTVNLDASVTDATSGSLTIYGAKPNDQIGTIIPEFLQIAGKADNYDMIIRSKWVDKEGDSGFTNEGAIYVLWDVADYYSAETDKNKTIDLGNLADANSGLLTIYGRETVAYLGSDRNNILYDDADALTNIDGDVAGTIDIAFRDGRYTYILFGDKVATTTGAGVDEKVDSKTVDLAVVETALGTDAAGFFGYDFDGASGSAAAVDRVGYRFVGSKTDLDAVQTDYDGLPSSLSDTDSGIAVWDIA